MVFLALLREKGQASMSIDPDCFDTYQSKMIDKMGNLAIFLLEKLLAISFSKIPINIILKTSADSYIS